MAEYGSNLAMVTSVVVYLLALAAFAAEWAAARKLEPEVVPAGVLVDSAGDELAGSDAATDVAKPASVDDTAARIRVDMFGRMGLALTMVGAVVHLAGVVLRGVSALTGLEARVLLVDDVEVPAAADDLRSRCCGERPDGGADLHRSPFVVGVVVGSGHWVGGRAHQLDLVTPGSSPAWAISRRRTRDRPNLR